MESVKVKRYVFLFIPEQLLSIALKLTLEIHNVQSKENNCSYHSAGTWLAS